MFVPVVPNTTVINKTVVYSDTVLPLKDIGDNLKITSVDDVSEYSLESCLKTIFKSNPNVVFNTIQYSKNAKKVYFYTNQDITTEAYEESKFTNYKPISSRTEILEEIKEVLLSPKNKDNNCISLYDVLMLLKSLNNEYDSVEKGYESDLEYMVINKIGHSSSVCLHGFDFRKKVIHISFSRFRSSDYDDIYIAKENGDLYVVKSECCYTDEVFSVLCSILSEMYDKFLEYADYKDYRNIKNNIKPVNSNFSVEIGYYGIRLSVADFTNKYLKELELFAPSYDSGYELKCNSSIVNEAFRGKETEIFRKIFVKISDCPEWSQATLYKFRQKQLEEEQKIEGVLKDKKMRKEKILALKRRFFPFLKK